MVVEGWTGQGSPTILRKSKPARNAGRCGNSAGSRLDYVIDEYLLKYGVGLFHLQTHEFGSESN